MEPHCLDRVHTGAETLKVLEFSVGKTKPLKLLYFCPQSLKVLLKYLFRAGIMVKIVVTLLRCRRNEDPTYRPLNLIDLIPNRVCSRH